MPNNTITATSSIDDLFMEGLGSMTSVEHVTKHIDMSKHPIFVEEDIYRTNHPIARVLRSVFVKHNITHEYFEQKHRDFKLMQGETDNKIINSDRNNIKRAIRKPSVTYNRFEIVLCLILGFMITDVYFELQSLRGEKAKFRYIGGDIPPTDIESVEELDPDTTPQAVFDALV